MTKATILSSLILFTVNSELRDEAELMRQ